jgi:glycosyltransferase involved in cell wall biosynthesis
MTLVSYVIPCFNSELYIIDCLDSVFSQKNVNVEAVVVDDGSRDRSVKLVSSFIAGHPQYAVCLYTHEGCQNKGVSASRRLGFSQARGDFICFLDSDDYLINAHKTALQLAEFQKHSQLVMVHCAVQVVGHGQGLTEVSEYFNANYRHNIYRLPELTNFLISNHICNSTSMIRRSALDGLPFDSLQCFQYEDWSLWLLLSQLGKFKCLSIEGIAYRVHEDSATSYVLKNRLRHFYSLIECKLIFLARCGVSLYALRILLSIRRELVGLIDCYLVEGNSGRHLPIGSAATLLILKACLFPCFFLRSQLRKRAGFFRHLAKQ